MQGTVAKYDKDIQTGPVPIQYIIDIFLWRMRLSPLHLILPEF